MQIDDTGIIIGCRSYGDDSAIVTVLTFSNGKLSGFVKATNSKSNRGIVAIGNIVTLNWRSRIEDQLGYFKLELSRSIFGEIYSNFAKLNNINSLATILYKTLAEREPQESLFQAVHDYLKILCSSDNWRAAYIILELKLLELLGFGLDITKCAITNSSINLFYVSPKSGRAVTKDVGEPYHHKLLRLPNFILQQNITEQNSDELKNGLALSSFFLNKYLFQPFNYKLPQNRI